MTRFFIGMLLSAAAVCLRAETPTITEQPVSLTITNGGTAVFTVAASGTGPFTYQWRFNGTNLSSRITKVAGAVVQRYPTSTMALLDYPTGIAADGAGNVFIADSHRICKVDSKGIIRTIAGASWAGFSGDGGAAIDAVLNKPASVVLDGLGNLFIADSGNNRIRKIDVNGIITTVAGNGTNTFSGDGGPAVEAGLGNPQGVALDKTGSLFILASGRVRKVNADGVITTVAGGGTGGDGGAATNTSLTSPRSIALDDLGNLFIAEQRWVRKVDAQGTITRVAGGGYRYPDAIGYPATDVMLYPQGLAVDGFGNLFISDLSTGSRICKVDSKGIITPVVDPLMAGALALDGSGNLFVANSSIQVPGLYGNNGAIVKLQLGSGTAPELVLTNAGAGNAGDYSVVVRSPGGVVTSQVATLTVLMPPSITSQPTNQVVAPGETASFKVSASGEGALSYCWLRDGTPVTGGDGSSYSIPSVRASDSGAQFRCVVSSAYGSVTSYVARLSVAIAPSITQQPVSRFVTNGNTVVFSVAGSGMGPLSYQWQVNGTNLSPTITTVAGNGSRTYSGDGGAATNAGLWMNPDGYVASDGAGNLFILADNRIRKVDANGIITTIAGNGSLGYSGDGGLATNARLYGSRFIVSDGLGNLFFSDQYERCIRKVDTAGIISTVVGNWRYYGDGGPATNLVLFSMGIAVGGSGDLFLADYYNQCIRKVDASGMTTVAGNGTAGYAGDGGLAISAALSSPQGVAVDGLGNLWIADTTNNCVRRVDANGIITTVAGNRTAGYGGDGGLATSAMLNYPTRVAVDGAGNLLIADSRNCRIRKVDAAGIITTVAGNGSFAYSGEGVPATSTGMAMSSVALDNSGNLFIADVYNSRIRKVNYLFGATPTLVLTNVDAAQAGSYSVVVRSPYGCVTSSVVKLSVWGALPPQEFSGVVTEQANVALQFKGGTPGYPYVLLTTTNLTPPVSWEAVGTNLTDGDGVWRMSASVTNADLPARFFRVLGQQP